MTKNLARLDRLLGREERKLGATLTETQHFGFNIPEYNIHSLCLMWHHPNLKTVTGGAYAWQGIKEDNFECELFDFVTSMSDDCLRNDLWDYELDNSYHVQTIEPLKIRYNDPVHQDSFDIHYEAIMRPMVLSSGLHLEQAMKMTGHVTLRGRTYEVNGYNVRNATCITLISHHFETGSLSDIKLSLIVSRYLPHFIAQAAALIESYGKH